MKALDTSVLIVGAGPVGLFLALCLKNLGIPFLILEKDQKRRLHSRSIGIHPPSLERFQALDLAQNFIEKGIKITHAQVFTSNKKLGNLSFQSCPKPFSFILTIPQYETESILEKKLLELAPESLLKNVTVTGIDDKHDHVSLSYHHNQTPDEGQELSAHFVVACDGQGSSVRTSSQIPFKGKAYPDSYLMGDFEDSTYLGNDAGIYLSPKGVIESFPLPDNKRRWVAKTTSFIKNPQAERLVSIINSRLMQTVPPQTNSMMSSFVAKHYLAKHFVKGRIILAGDAAHVMSPIGGQGMNVGWLDAWQAAQAIADILHDNYEPKTRLNLYHKQQMKIARTAKRRAEFNMALGRASSYPGLKSTFVKLLLSKPIDYVFSRVFTMRWL